MTDAKYDDPNPKINPWRDLWRSLLDDAGILDDDKPDTLKIDGLSWIQCSEYTGTVLELLHKEGK